MINYEQDHLALTGEETFDELMGSLDKTANMRNSSGWWIADAMKAIVDRFPEKSTGQLDAKSQAHLQMAEVYPISERVKGVTYEIHKALMASDERHKLLLLAKMNSWTLHQAKQAVSPQIEMPIKAEGKALQPKHRKLIDELPILERKCLTIGEHSYSFKSDTEAMKAQNAVKDAIEQALKLR